MYRDDYADDFRLPPREHLASVHERLREGMEELGVEVLVALSAENSYFVSGYASSLSYFLSTPDDGAIVVLWRSPEAGLTHILTDFEGYLFPAEHLGYEVSLTGHWTGVVDEVAAQRQQIAHQRPEPETTLSGGGTYANLGELLDRLPRHARVGVDLDGVSARNMARVTHAAGGREVVDMSALLTTTRARKTEWEIGLLEAACAVTEGAITSACATIEPGVSEVQLRTAHDSFLASQGAGVRLSGITVGGSYSIRRFPSERGALAGETVKFDCGGEFLEYGADIARVFSVTQTPDATMRTYDALRTAHDKVAATLGPGVRCAEVFELGMRLVRDGVLEGYRRGHIGHSVGLSRSVEEPPFFGPKEEARLEVGMVMSLEIPFYSRTTGGLNIEDMFVITESGARCFNALSKDLIAL